MFPPDWLLPILLLIFSGVVAILFLPSVLEIKKPRDKGPRKMLEPTVHQIEENGQLLDGLLASCSSAEKNPQEESRQIQSNRNVEVSRLNSHLIRLIGDNEFAPSSEVRENVVVKGSIKIGDRCKFLRSVKAYGSITVGSDVFIGEHLVSSGDVNLGKGTVVNGAIDAKGSVRLGKNTFVGCSVVAGRDVELQENSKVRGGIFTVEYTRVASKPKLDFESTVVDRPAL